MPVTANVDFSGAVRLLGWSEPAQTIMPGEKIALDLFWQALDVRSLEPGSVIRILAQQNGQDARMLWEGVPVMGRYPFDQWQLDELVIDRHRWRIPIDFPDGAYTLLLELNGSRVALAALEILPVERLFEAPDYATEAQVDLDGTIRLEGFTLIPDVVNAGESVDLNLIWRSLEETDLALTVFVHIVGADGIPVAQRDAAPHENTYPVALWMATEYVEDGYSIALPETLAAGQYTVRVGMYVQASGQRLAVLDLDGRTLGDYFDLGTITVP